MEFETVRRERAGENFCPRGVAGGRLPGTLPMSGVGSTVGTETESLYASARAHISHLTGTREEGSPRPKLGAGPSNQSLTYPNCIQSTLAQLTFYSF